MAHAVGMQSERRARRKRVLVAVLAAFLLGSGVLTVVSGALARDPFVLALGVALMVPGMAAESYGYFLKAAADRDRPAA